MARSPHSSSSETPGNRKPVPIPLHGRKTCQVRCQACEGSLFGKGTQSAAAELVLLRKCLDKTRMSFDEAGSFPETTSIKTPTSVARALLFSRSSVITHLCFLKNEAMD